MSRGSLTPRVETKVPSKHTPGPWRALCGKHFTRVMRDSQGPADQTGTVQLCHIAGPEEDGLRPWNKDRWEADAKLMAAAPDLLESLRAVTPLLRMALLSTTVEIAREARPFLDAADAAIANAGG